MPAATPTPAADAVKILSLEEILSSNDIAEREVLVPEWGGAVKVRGVSREEHRRLVRYATVKGELDNDRLEQHLVCAAMTSPKIGPEQYLLLLKKSTGAVQRVLNAILDESGMTADALKEREDAFRGEPRA